MILPPLSYSAYRVLQAVTQGLYSLNPEDVVNETARISYILSLAITAAAEQCPADTDYKTKATDSFEEAQTYGSWQVHDWWESLAKEVKGVS